MKKFLLLALCALFACDAGARTLYVDSRRPNNKGNGLSAKKAKATLQAAINVSQKGDTIIVLAGSYDAPIKTANRKIAIKAKSGPSNTTVTTPDWWLHKPLLDFGKGTATKFVGFTVTPNYDRQEANYGCCGGTIGGTIQKCKFLEIGGTCTKYAFLRSNFAVCSFEQCRAASATGGFMKNCTLNRCKVTGTMWMSIYSRVKIVSCEFYNTLFADNHYLRLAGCRLVNDTVANNEDFRMASIKAYNTIFYKVGASQFKAAKKNKFSKCYKGNSPGFAVPEDVWVSVYEPGLGECSTLDASADYHLLADSRCVDKGSAKASLQKLFGSKDLDGRKRVRGASVDLGCYER